MVMSAGDATDALCACKAKTPCQECYENKWTTTTTYSGNLPAWANGYVGSLGYSDSYRGWFDLHGCGRANSYCRWEGNSGSGGDPSQRITHGSSVWTCALAGTSTIANDDIYGPHAE